MNLTNAWISTLYIFSVFETNLLFDSKYSNYGALKYEIF